MTPNAYSMTLNPQGTDVDSSQCSFMVQITERDIYEKLKLSNCKTSEYRKQKYFEHYLKVSAVLPQLNLSLKEIENEREKFIDKMFEIMKHAEETCISDD